MAAVEVERQVSGGRPLRHSPEDSPDHGELDAALISAHMAGDREALVGLYHRAGLGEQAAGEIDAAAFFFTQAYVFALEAGDARAASLRERLIELGREEEPGSAPMGRKE